MSPEERVKNLIDTHCLSQAKIARSMDMSDKTLSLIVNSKRRLNVSELKKFCDAVHISADDFFIGVD